MIKHLLTGLLSLCFMPAISAADLSSYRAEVTATRYGAIDIKAKGSTSFSLDGDHWQFQISVKGGGLKSEEISKGFIEDGQFKPETYHKLTKFLFIKENIDWTFDWPHQKVKGKVKKDTYEHSTGDSLHDPLSFQAPLREAIRDGETSLSYQYLRYNRPQKLTFEVIGEELLSLESGRVHTLILKQTAPMRSDNKKLVWIAKDFDYIPVRFASYKKDKLKDDITIDRLWINGKEVEFDDL